MDNNNQFNNLSNMPKYKCPSQWNLPNGIKEFKKKTDRNRFISLAFTLAAMAFWIIVSVFMIAGTGLCHTFVYSCGRYCAGNTNSCHGFNACFSFFGITGMAIALNAVLIPILVILILYHIFWRRGAGLSLVLLGLKPFAIILGIIFIFTFIDIDFIAAGFLVQYIVFSSLMAAFFIVAFAFRLIAYRDDRELSRQADEFEREHKRQFDEQVALYEKQLASYQLQQQQYYNEQMQEYYNSKNNNSPPQNNQ